MVWNEKLKSEIPDGWVIKEIQDIANTYSGGTPKSSVNEYYENGNIPWINSGELNEPIITSTNNFISKLGLDNSSAKLYPQGTTLIALYGATAGKVSLLAFEACSNQAVCGVMAYDKHLQAYIRFYLSSMYDHFVTLSTGSARNNISQNTVKNTFIVIPNDRILMLFDRLINCLTTLLVNNHKEIDTMTKQRDALLPLLMNGQVMANNQYVQKMH